MVAGALSSGDWQRWKTDGICGGIETEALVVAARMGRIAWEAGDAVLNTFKALT